MTTDILVCHNRDVIYPLWMWRINRDRHLFGRVVIVMTQSSSERHYTDYIKQTVKDATVVTHYPSNYPDWRQNSIIEGLYETRGDRVLFLEQDLFVLDGFFEKLLHLADSFDAVGFREGDRFHPACLLATQDAIARTRKDFSVDPDKGDHFSKFTTDIEQMHWKALNGYYSGEWWHMGGLTQNFRLQKNFYKKQDFYAYLYYSLKMEQPETWRDFCHQVQLNVIADCIGGVEIDTSNIYPYFKGAL